MQRDEFRCQVCFAGELTLHIHHKRYLKGRKVWEYDLADLVTVCESCHDSLHQQRDEARDILAALPVDGPASLGDCIGLIAGWALAHRRIGTERVPEDRPFTVTAGQVAAFVEELGWRDKAAMQKLRDHLAAALSEGRFDVLSRIAQALDRD